MYTGHGLTKMIEITGFDTLIFCTYDQQTTVNRQRILTQVTLQWIASDITKEKNGKSPDS
jgi:hypothetical protein